MLVLRLLIRGDFAPRLDMIAVTKILTLSSLLFRVEEYIMEGRDQNIVDSDPDSVYSKRNERFDKTKDNSGISATQIPLSFPSDGWSADIRRMPFFTRAEMNLHISKPGKRIDPTSKAHSVPTSIRKATTFLNDQYLKSISAIEKKKREVPCVRENSSKQQVSCSSC